METNQHERKIILGILQDNERFQAFTVSGFLRVTQKQIETTGKALESAKKKGLIVYKLKRSFGGNCAKYLVRLTPSLQILLQKEFRQNLGSLSNTQSKQNKELSDSILKGLLSEF